MDYKIRFLQGGIHTSSQSISPSVASSVLPLDCLDHGVDRRDPFRRSRLCYGEAGRQHFLLAGNHRAGGPDCQLAPPRLRKDKEIAGDFALQKERTLVINMTSVRQAARTHFLAIVLFLSTLLVSSDVLMERMKKVWRVRGHAEANQIEAEEGRKFVIEFSEEGDRRHVLHGGPWQYKMDAFLVEPLEVGADPTTVAFTHVPMWVQFHGIPFYLLTKNLAWDIGWEIGTTVMIDNNSRGNISDKFLRARVQLPLYAALRDMITLADEITAEEVKVQIFYERLPNFCLFCGYIGHMEARCDLSAADRKVNFSMEMRVLPVHFDDPRAWYLPDAMGMARAQPAPVAPWRATKPASAPIKQAAIEQVAEDVAKLKVVDTNYIPSATVADKQADPPLLMALPAGTVEADKVVTALYPLGNEGNTDKLRGKNKKMMPDQLEEQNATALYTNNGAAPVVKVAAPQLSAASRHSNEDDTVVTATLLPKKKVSWKRMQREEEVQSKLQNMCTSQARVLGVTRERPETE